MTTALQKTTHLLAAFSVAVLSLNGPAAQAQSVDAEAPTQAQIPYLSSEEALAESNGRVLLHVGEGYDPIALHLDIQVLERAGLEVSVASGGPENGITPYFYGNHFPNEVYNEDTSTNMIAILIEVARQHNLISTPATTDP